MSITIGEYLIVLTRKRNREKEGTYTFLSRTFTVKHWGPFVVYLETSTIEQLAYELLIEVDLELC